MVTQAAVLLVFDLNWTLSQNNFYSDSIKVRLPLIFVTESVYLCRLFGRFLSAEVAF